MVTSNSENKSEQNMSMNKLALHLILEIILSVQIIQINRLKCK